MNIARSVEVASLYFPDKPALIFEGKTYTYKELNQQVNRLANALAALGLEKGDRVGLFLPNIPGFVIGYYAAQKLGAIVVSINSMSKKREVQYIVSDSGCKILFTTRELREEVPTGELPELKNIIIAEGEAGNDLDINSLMAKGVADFRCRDMDPGDGAAILYTSGTTGYPKGAVLSHMNVVSNSTTAGNCSGVMPQDRLQLFLPLFHCFGQNYIMNGAYNKCATIVLHRRFEPEPVLDAMVRHRVTMSLPCLPFISTLSIWTPPGMICSSLRYCFTAAATMPRETALQWQEKFGMLTYEGYGLTEASPCATYNHNYRHKHGSIGRPIENVDVMIADDEAMHCPMETREKLSSGDRT